MPGKLLSEAEVESEAVMEAAEQTRKHKHKKDKKEKSKNDKLEKEPQVETEELDSPKPKKVKKGEEVISPKPKKAKKKEQLPEDEEDFSPKPKKAKKSEEGSVDEPKSLKERGGASTDEVCSKAKKTKKKEEPSEIESPLKPKKAKKKEREVNGDTGEKTPKLEKVKENHLPKGLESHTLSSKGLKSQLPAGLTEQVKEEEEDEDEDEDDDDDDDDDDDEDEDQELEKPKKDKKKENEKDSKAEDTEELSAEQKEGAFSNFPISEETIQLLKARGVTYLFPIQAKTFHHVSSGKDLIAQARTGTGKTFSFAIPLIEKLQGDTQPRARGRAPKILVLAPTRELSIQVSKDFSDITKKLTVACFYGGTPYNGQIDLIRRGIDILVGTPGRIKDHLQNGRLDLTKVQHVVLDEVDQMLDMGFAEQVEEILTVAYKKDSEDNPQTLLFSATCPHWVYDVAKKYMKSTYEQVDLIGKKTQKAAVTVEHLAINCHWSQRAAVIGDVIQVYSGSHGRTIIFCETKKEAQELSLNESIKQDAQSLHGDIPQKQREITLQGFRNGKFGVLVATNVAARGLDIPEVDLVIQSSPPKDVESYIHRSGRTGRAGRTGICICFYQKKEQHQLAQVERQAGITFKRVGVPSASEIIKASSKDAIRFLDSVPPAAINNFRQTAQKLIDEKGAVEALAAALAHISGATTVEQRSLINSDVGFVTMVLQCSIEMHNIGYAWRGLKEQLGEEIDDKVTRMTFLKGKTGVCFDVPAAEVKSFQDHWQDSRRWQLSVATERPELEQQPDEGRGFSNFRSGGGRGGRGGGRGGGGRGGRSGGFGGFNRNDKFQNRGQKRSFQRAFSHR
ncbi:nucleolar RNA helicase 2 isoform X2 [Gracilinanus agilis]|uniref:nucleolar RNA helicase 2 isoform X2 n=1 Tax=Gracilinanus agilis TaxID=191870 RepID=UPI001CFD8038|nr:nucleolar RNA helicase 2 isoform X2 [Gracilinanus agilis]